jgi:hypothetical protein
MAGGLARVTEPWQGWRRGLIWQFVAEPENRFILEENIVRHMPAKDCDDSPNLSSSSYA